MSFHSVFKRYELKYMLTREQKERVIKEIDRFMRLDEYGKTTIRNLYYDTDSYLLIRRSIEKPVYKEKLRIRSYCKVDKDSLVFVELKKKYKHIVYKRRISLPECEAMKWLSGEMHRDKCNQITKEIEYFMKLYESLHPVLFLSYEREAYYAKDGTDFRVTFDNNILCRQEALSLRQEAYGTNILSEDKILMEIKCSGGIPIWMTNILSKEKIYKTSFSKYGTAYRKIIFPQTHKLNEYNMMEVNRNA